MALKKRLRDKDGNLIYPDVGIDLDEVIYGSDPGEVSEPVAWIETTDIKDGQITSKLLKGWSTANTTDEWVPVATSNYELQHRIIKPFNADGSVPASAIDWGTVSKQITHSSFVGNSPSGNNYWRKIGNLTFPNHNQGKSVWLRILLGFGNNGNATQQAYVDLVGQLGWTGNNSGRAGWSAVLNAMNTSKTTSAFDITVIANSVLNYDVYIKAASSYMSVTPVYVPGYNDAGSPDPLWTPDYTSSWSQTTPSGTECAISKQVITPTS